MEFRKYKSIKVSERVLEKAVELVEDLEIDILMETFNNCREQGFNININNKKFDKWMTIWAYSHRNSDQPTVTWKYGLGSQVNGMYGEEEYYKRTISFETEDKAAEYISKLIKMYFVEGIEINEHKGII